MAKQIIILEFTPPATIKVIFWLAVPAARQAFYANPNATSSYTLATIAETDALKNGQVVEEVVEFGLDVTDTAKLSAARAFLQAEFTKRQNRVNSYNPWLRFGTYFDSVTGWNIGGVS